MRESNKNTQGVTFSGRIITKEERRWVFIWSAVIVFVTCIPVIVAWVQTPEGWYYTGLLLNPGDSNTYLAKMRQGFDGKWLMSIAHTSEPHNPTFLHPFYLLLGHFARVFQLQLGFTFQFFRAITSYILLLVLYLFCALFWQEQIKRRIAFFYTIFASGFGWFLAFFDIPSSDLAVPESVTFLTLLSSPHFSLSLSLIIINLIWGAKSLLNRSWTSAIFLGFGQLILLYIHPHDIVITFLTLGIYFLSGWLIYKQWHWKISRYLILGWIICIPGIIHNLTLFTRDGLWRLWVTQEHPEVPAPVFFVSGYGLFTILAICGLVVIFLFENNRKQRVFQIVAIWVLFIILIIYLPIQSISSVQVRLPKGLQIPIIFLGIEAIFYFDHKLWGNKFVTSKYWIPLLIFFSLSNILIFSGTFWRMKTPEIPWFYTTDDIDVMHWLEQNGTDEDIVLSLEWTGNHIPTQANVHVYVGHLYETIDYYEKLETAQIFFEEEMTEDEAWCFLRINGIDWVFIGSQEIETPFLPDQKPYLLKSFSAGESAIYYVTRPPSTLQCNAPTR